MKKFLSVLGLGVLLASSASAGVLTEAPTIDTSDVALVYPVLFGFTILMTVLGRILGLGKRS